MKNILADHPLELLILLPCQPSESFLKKLELLSVYGNWFSSLGLSVILSTDAPAYDHGAIRQMLGFKLSFCRYSLDVMAQRHDCTQNRPVFGLEREFAISSLILMKDSTPVFQTRRINDQAIRKMLQCALKIQSQWLKTQLSCPIDTPDQG